MYIHKTNRVGNVRYTQVQPIDRNLNWKLKYIQLQIEPLRHRSLLDCFYWFANQLHNWSTPCTAVFTVSTALADQTPRGSFIWMTCDRNTQQNSRHCWSMYVKVTLSPFMVQEQLPRIENCFMWNIYNLYAARYLLSLDRSPLTGGTDRMANNKSSTSNQLARRRY